MAPSSMTTLADAFKTLFSNKLIQDLSFKDKPLYAMIPKDHGFYGTSEKTYTRYGKPVGGASSTFANAQSGVDASKGVAFDVTRVPDYGLVHLDRESLEASEKDIGAFFDLKKDEQRLSLEHLAERIHWKLYTDKKGYIGTVGSESTTTLTLATITDGNRFEVGQEIMARSSAHSARSGSATITGVNRESGILTTDSNWTSQITGLVATDRLHIKGDYDLSISGLDAWIPSSAPGATTFFGVNRSVDTRLGGLRYDGSALLVTEAITQALYTASLYSAKGIGHCFLAPMQFAAMVSELDSKVDYVKDVARGDKGKEIASVGFEGIKFVTPHGTVKVFPDPMCQANVAWLLNLSRWAFKSLKGAPRVLSSWDVMRTRESADGFEIRNGWNGNLTCTAPGDNMRVTLAAV